MQHCFNNVVNNLKIKKKPPLIILHIQVRFVIVLILLPYFNQSCQKMGQRCGTYEQRNVGVPVLTRNLLAIEIWKHRNSIYMPILTVIGSSHYLQQVEI